MTVVERLPNNATPRQVIRAVHARMREEFKRNPKARAARKSAYQLALAHHEYWKSLRGTE